MSLNFLRGPSINNNAVLDTLRKRVALSFRKKLGIYNYKVKPSAYYKNPHAMPLKIREKLKKEESDHGIRKIHALERLSAAPFGRLTHKGKFLMDSKRIPNYNIPDTEDFELKPYVTYKSNKLEDTIDVQYLDRDTLSHIRDDLYASNNQELQNLARDIFDTEEGKIIIEEFLAMKKKNKISLKTNF